MHPSVRLLHARRRLRRVHCSPIVAAIAGGIRTGPAVDAPVRHPSRPSATATALGCLTVRRIRDVSGRPWTVRELPAKHWRPAVQAGHDTELLFECAVPGITAAIRRSRRPLESLTDGALAAMLTRDGD